MCFATWFGLIFLHFHRKLNNIIVILLNISCRHSCRGQKTVSNSHTPVSNFGIDGMRIKIIRKCVVHIEKLAFDNKYDVRHSKQITRIMTQN